MRRFRYYILGIPLMVLLFSFNVNAQVSNTTGTATTADNDTITIVGKTFTSEPYNTAVETEFGYDYTWTINQNFELQGLSRYSYYNGTLSFRVTSTTSLTTNRTLPYLANTMVADGVHCFIDAGPANYYVVIIIFDNYQPKATYLGLPTITQDIVLHTVDPVAYPTTMNISVSFSNITSGNLRKTETPLDAGVASVIADSIDNSTALSVIAGYLYTIKEQDITYYTQITSQIAALTQSQNTANANLLLILQELDLDFQQVQTILDLFPSYRTQVLQYWQQLLEMNAAQSSAAAEIESQYADRESQSSQLINGMGSVVMPSISSNDLDILGTVDTAQKANFFGIIALITHNELVTKIMLIIVLGAIVGYILYGKK